MKVSLNYGHDLMALDIPDENYMGTLNSKNIKKIEDTIGSKKLKKLV